jgi:ABC-2 type transport system permease protein
MRAFINHFSFEFHSGIRNKNLLLMNYLFPLGFYGMMGLIMPPINPFFLENMIPAVVIVAILAISLLGLPTPLVTAREAGIFRNYKINGIPAFSILAIPALSTILHTFMVTAIITLTAPLLFNAPLPFNWTAFVLILVLMAFACAGFGILIGVISPNTQMSVLWSQIIFIPSMMLSGLMLPFGFLPKGVQKVAQLLPATHAMNALRGLALNQPADFNPTGSLVILFSSGILAFWLANYLFNWDRKNDTRRGHPLLAVTVMVPYILGIFLL